MATGKVAFVLGGGGHLGAHEVGMLRALLERGVVPDLVVGTSVGAINGAAVAAEPTPAAITRLSDMWMQIENSDAFDSSVLGRLTTLARSRTHLHENDALRRLLSRSLPAEQIEDLPVTFECVAACIETASERWFSSGPLVDAVMASSAVPGILPPLELGGEHFLDGGIVNSIPISRAVELGAREIFVLQAGRIEAPLSPPRTPLQVALVAFEIARRHRFSRDLASLPEGVVAHVLPTGEPKRPSLSQLNYRDFKTVARRIDRAYRASMEYLESALPITRP